jgi:DNA-binding NarL/FixJ family response regulator
MNHQSDSERPEQPGEPTGSLPLRVLLVEDSAAVAERIAGQIGALDGVELIATVESESAAVDSLRHGGLDAVVLDLTLKQGSGFGVLRSRQELGLPVAIVVYTSYDIPAYRRAAAVFGASEFLNKARDHDKLPLVLKSLAGAAAARRTPLG